MLNLNKKQVGALLKFIPKDGVRPVLEALYITKDGMAIATLHGFILAILEIDKEDATEIEGRLIRRSAIEKWHKLATGKDRLTTSELVKVSQQDYADNGSYMEGDYPDMTKAIKGLEIEPVENIRFNADYMTAVQTLAKDQPLVYKLHGKLKPMIATDVDNNTYVIMPMKEV